MSSNAASLIFSAVVAAATVAYVLLTWRLVKETRLLRVQQFRPQVTVRVEPGQAALGFIDLVVENIGSGPAYDLAFTYDSDLEVESNPKRRLSDIGFLRNGVRYLGPRNELRTYLMTLFGRTNEMLQGKDRPRFKLDVRYKDGLAGAYSESFEIDFAHLGGIVRVGSPPLPEIAKHLDHIADAFTRLASGFAKLKVIQYSLEDVEREEDQFRLAQLSGQLIEEATKDTEPPKPDANDAA
jgi:hypothetical protein